MKAFTTVILASVVGLAGAASAAEEVNVYSSRHYGNDQELFDLFTEKTGIAVNRIEGKGPALLERLKAEGEASPADVFITVDAGMFWRGEEAGVFEPISSAYLEERIPAHLRDPEGEWFGFSKRARVIYADADKLDALPERYEDLAKPEYKGQICIRSSSNIYNLSLMSSIIAADGQEAAQAWAEGVVANMARDPQGGDTDQIRAVGAGECTLSVGNTYYVVRLLTGDNADEKAMAERLTVIFPNQGDRGTHVNVSGAGVVKGAENQANAVKLLEFLASDEAQEHFAQGNNEYPVVPGVATKAAVVALGDFKEDQLNVSVLGKNQPEAQKLMDRAGWK
ncbi:MAG: Fe(3+) ABC transporter substrate-binding protein [Rhodospirillales bacterium]